ncbi:hypothetical protein E2C01_056969 [Portunus trituberculatus]|uniref:Uncharacterized protein n=1 Tax=Portunus trituberculatus TaxID=210409 RepID=A0A5B7GZ50_PORTR|nr:hypothetical protein [Portunus trituberculatus]
MGRRRPSSPPTAPAVAAVAPYADTSLSEERRPSVGTREAVGPPLPPPTHPAAPAPRVGRETEASRRRWGSGGRAGGLSRARRGGGGGSRNMRGGRGGGSGGAGLMEGSAPGQEGRRPPVPHSESVSPAGDEARLRSGRDLWAVTVAGSAR